MKPYDFVHLTFLAVGDKIQGKTKLQKTVYFLGLMTGQLDDLGYRAHYYGPYSDEVADAVSTLQGIGFVSSEVAGIGSVDPQGFEIRRTDYRLTEEGRVIAEKKTGQFLGLFVELKKAALLLQRAGDLDYVRLSIAAKTYFMLREKNAPASEVELEQLAKRFGWNVSQDQLREAVQYLGKLNLVEPLPT